MRGSFCTQLVLFAQKWWQTIHASCYFAPALVRFRLILLSSLGFLSRAFPILLILNFFSSCVLNSEWWEEGLHLNLNPRPKQLFSSVNLCGIQNRHVVYVFCASGEAVPELCSLPTDFCQSQSVWGTHSGRPGAPWHMASRFISEWFCEGLHIDKTFL